MGIFSVFQDVYNYMFVKPIEKKPNLGEDLRLLVQSSEFEKQLQTLTPLLVTGIVAWPSYWLYRGLIWNHVNNAEPLPLYIRKTFYRAKVVEFALLFAGIILAVRSSRRSLARQLVMQEVVQKK